ncbi:MAG: esterase-like activity of phytase family protein [Pseudomonadota bacterium]
MFRSLALAFLCAAAAATAQNAPSQSVVWSEPEAEFGGFSGLTLSDDGTHFVAVTDRGHFATGRLTRKNGQISAVILDSLAPVLDTQGQPVTRFDVDAEALTRGPDGSLYVSFEANHRVWAYTDVAAPARQVPIAKDFRGLQNNSGLEAMFTGPDGAIYALPERSGKLSRPFPVYRFDGTDWHVAFTLPRRPPHLPTGADLGPDGRLYLLERDFRGLRGFASRIRSFAITPSGLGDEQLHVDSRLGAHDNLEGISVWRDSVGQIRLTTLSDDNMNFFQRTEWVEFTLPLRIPMRPRVRPRS